MDATVVEMTDGPESAALPSSVHTEETTGQFLDGSGQDFAPVVEDTQAELFGQSGFRARLFKKIPDLVIVTRSVFDEHDVSDGSNWLSRFEVCRTLAWFVWNVEIEMIRVHSNSCRLRWCPVCAEARSNTIAHSCCEFFSKQSAVRFLTLTQKHTDLSLDEQITRIKKSFAQLRRCAGWRKYVTGCVWFLQVKPSCGGKWWHVHLHMLLTGSYIPQKWLSEKWLKVTGDSKIVDIRSVCNLDSALSDVVRYAGRPANLLDVSEKYRMELVCATDKIRICGTTGICRAVSLRPPKFKQDNSRYKVLGRYSTIMKLAAAGDERARDIVRAERNGTPLENAHSFQGVDDFIDDKFPGFGSVEPMPPDLFSPNERAPPE